MLPHFHMQQAANRCWRCWSVPWAFSIHTKILTHGSFSFSYHFNLSQLPSKSNLQKWRHEIFNILVDSSHKHPFLSAKSPSFTPPFSKPARATSSPARRRSSLSSLRSTDSSCFRFIARATKRHPAGNTRDRRRPKKRRALVFIKSPSCVLMVPVLMLAGLNEFFALAYGDPTPPWAHKLPPCTSCIHWVCRPKKTQHTGLQTSSNMYLKSHCTSFAVLKASRIYPPLGRCGARIRDGPRLSLEATLLRMVPVLHQRLFASSPPFPQDVALCVAHLSARVRSYQVVSGRGCQGPPSLFSCPRKSLTRMAQNGTWQIENEKTIEVGLRFRG